MVLTRLNSRADAPVQPAPKTLLLVGPLPPPLGGATLTVQTLLEELAGYASIRVNVVDTRMPLDYRQKKIFFELNTLKRAIFIIKQYVEQIHRSHAVLVFANNSFILTLVPLLFGLARCYRKPFYLKPIGGDLDLYLAAQKKPLRSWILYVLQAMDGVLPQTRQLQTTLINWGCNNTYYVPGCRATSPVRPAQNRNSDKLRLIYLSQIKPEKGTLVLLEALRLLAQAGPGGITCDFYGPIYQDSQEQFFQELKATPGVRYCGLAEGGTASQLIATYDALVLPTYFVSEGHPGVIIEAMQAGVPVISTYHRAIPELIRPGENGFLVPVQSSLALAEAIKQLAQDRLLRQQMGQASYQQAQAFRADVVVPQLLEIVFPPDRHSALTKLPA